MTAKRKAALYVLYLFGLLILFLVSAEVCLRWAGHKPWTNQAVSITAEPMGRLYERDPELGYKNIPGEHTVTLGTGYQFKITYGKDSLRITRPQNEHRSPEFHKNAIWIFGCSFTHGWSLNDDETFAWILQENFPNCDVVNFATCGYGTIHSLLQFKEALKQRNPPKIAVLVYGTFHDERNTFSRGRRKQVAPWNKLGPLAQPYARVSGDGLEYHVEGDVVYNEFPLMRSSALSHFLEEKYNAWEQRSLRSREVSSRLIRDMAETARRNNIRFIVARIYGGRWLEKAAAKDGFECVNINVDLTKPENTNLPHDNHPSAAAHKSYAESLIEAVGNCP